MRQIWQLLRSTPMTCYSRHQPVPFFSCNIIDYFQMFYNRNVCVNDCRLGQNRERTPHCIRTMETECDLTAELKNLKAYYSADILSEPMRGVSSDLVEFPHVRSEKFSPYHDSQYLSQPTSHLYLMTRYWTLIKIFCFASLSAAIGRPEFKIEVSSDKSKMSLHVTDVPTTLFDKDNERLNIRDVFGDNLQYKVTYRKAKSTGKVSVVCKVYYLSFVLSYWTFLSSFATF